MAVSSSRLAQMIAERIQREGPLTFATYMQMALYEPDYGYYVSGTARMGWTGDYFTSTDVSELFAYCLGQQLVRFWERLKRPAPFRILEQGAGRGNLAADVRAWAAKHNREFAQALIYETEEMRNGENSLAPTSAQPAHVLLSNELIDALPVHLVEIHEQQLYEVYVDYQNGQLCELLAAPSSPEVASYLDKARIPWRTFPDGWRTEINLDAPRWLEGALQRLKTHGFILAIDYGDKARELYTRERRRGTLLCYRQHQTNEHPLLFPGEQDITAHVNFSALIEQGRSLGLHLHRYTTQRQWLEDCGLSVELARRRQQDFSLADSQRASDQGQIALLEWYNLRQRAAILSDPGGMGNFKVLILRR